MNTPFNNPILRDWLFNKSAYHNTSVYQVVTTGSGPFNESEFDEFLKTNNIQAYEPGADIEVVIVGSDSCNQELLAKMIELRIGHNLKIYSQEMFMTFIMTGVDPFLGGRDILREYAKSHSTLEYLLEYGFDWPSTHVIKSLNSGTDDVERQEISPLKAKGYTVGKNGLPENVRHRILNETFSATNQQLGQLVSNYPIKEWGDDNTPARLYKMANHIASLIRNTKRRKASNMDQAIEDWDSDLEWLKISYYDRLGFSFQWPIYY
jgi:hypothetical protein